MGLRKTIWRRLPLQLHDASGESLTKAGHGAIICWNSVDTGGFRESAGHQPWLQHQWWDLWGGSSFEWAAVPCFFMQSIKSHLFYCPSTLSIKCLQNLCRCLCTVPSVRCLPLSGRSQSGASVSFPSSTSDFIQFWSPLTLSQGCTTTSSERMGNQCTLDIGTPSSTTTQASPPGFGMTGRTTEAWRSAFLQRRLSF